MMDDTRRKLIASARADFAYASMDGLTAAVGLTCGELYHYFGDKRGLFAKLWSRSTSRW